MYDAEAAQQLEAVVSEEKVHVQRCRETVDDLATSGRYDCPSVLDECTHLHAHLPLKLQTRQVAVLDDEKLDTLFFGSVPVTLLRFW